MDSRGWARETRGVEGKCPKWPKADGACTPFSQKCPPAEKANTFGHPVQAAQATREEGFYQRSGSIHTSKRPPERAAALTLFLISDGDGCGGEIRASRKIDRRKGGVNLSIIYVSCK